MNASLTGHLVLSTLHTNNAIGVIPRLIDMKVSPFLLPPALSLAIAQRLIKLLCPECKKRVEASKATKELIMHEVETLPESVRKKVEIKDPLYLYEAKGCKKCNNRGYKGRMGIFEVLEMTKGLEKIILGNPSEAEIYEEAKKQEMITMKQNGLLKVLQGLTTVEEVLRVAEEK
jgi:type IV pilus assembly protein PilB